MMYMERHCHIQGIFQLQEPPLQELAGKATRPKIISQLIHSQTTSRYHNITCVYWHPKSNSTPWIKLPPDHTDCKFRNYISSIALYPEFMVIYFASIYLGYQQKKKAWSFLSHLQTLKQLPNQLAYTDIFHLNQNQPE